MAEVERYGPGDEAEGLLPGDFVLTHRQRKLMPYLISRGQQLRFRGSERVYAHWSHAALVVDHDGRLVESETTGVQLSPLSRYRDREYHVVRLGEGVSHEQRLRAVEYANERVGSAFGFLVIASMAAWLLFDVHFNAVRRDHQICSGLVAHALQEAGQLAGLDPTFVLPADLAREYRVVP